MNKIGKTRDNRFRMSAIAALACVALLGAASSSDASVMTLQFDDGNGTASVDQYTGKGGSGWKGAWSTYTPSGSISGTVLNSSPLVTGGGNYLSVTTGGNSEKAARRQFDGSAAGQDVTQPYIIKFQFRIDTKTGWNADTDYVTISDRISGGTNYSPGADSTFIIRAAGATVNGIPANRWILYNGGRNSGSYNAALFTDSGMDAVTGTTYQFTVNLYPATRDWTVSIFDGTNTVTSGTLGFRTSAFSGNEWLFFNARNNASGDATDFSVDRIEVIPEPGSVGLLGLGAALLLRRARRRLLA